MTTATSENADEACFVWWVCVFEEGGGASRDVFCVLVSRARSVDFVHSNGPGRRQGGRRREAAGPGREREAGHRRAERRQNKGPGMRERGSKGEGEGEGAHLRRTARARARRELPLERVALAARRLELPPQRAVLGREVAGLVEAAGLRHMIVVWW